MLKRGGGEELHFFERDIRSKLISRWFGERKTEVPFLESNGLYGSLSREVNLYSLLCDRKEGW